ncbi:MAG TPA: response regulator transcription factor [Bacillales bacterium]|nr:response regulator transcription factor [Bacillales bacterium]
MYKLLIVDDEAIERQAMRLMLTRGIDNVEVAGEAANGKEAVRLAAELEPDIILMDIKMPGMDGLEAVRRIKKARPETKFIMVSAFDTFEYAREAMQEGVKEYLLKPSRKSEIIETVKRVVEEVGSEKEESRKRAKLEDQLGRALTFVRSEWVSSLLMDHVQETEASEWRDFLELGEGGVYAVVCRLSFPKEEKLKAKNKEIYEWLKKAFTEKAECLVGPMTAGMIPVLVIAKEDGRTARSQGIGMVKEILHEFDRNFDFIEARIGIGTSVSEVENFSRSYEEALVALEQTNENVRYNGYHPSLAGQSEPDVIKIEKQLLEAVKDGDSDGALSAFERYVPELSDAPETIQSRLRNLSFMLAKLAEEMGISAQMTPLYTEDADNRQMREWARVRVARAAEQIHLWQSENAYSLLEEARRYIDSRYHESITLEKVAVHVELSPYYFSKLFKEYNGSTFIEYLTEVRIRRAKTLLKSTRMSLKEICFEVGYHDPNYFSRVFKKSAGRSPSQYRASVSQQ